MCAQQKPDLASLSKAALTVAAVLALCATSSAQVATPVEQKTTKKANSSTTVRKHRVVEEDNSVAPAVVEAETAIDKHDLPKAEKLLSNVVSLDPRDYRAWFDLAFVYNATQRRSLAIDAYRKSIALKPSVFEANLNLGLLLFVDGKPGEAAKFLRAATTLKPDSKDPKEVTRAWISLGNVLQKNAPEESIAAFRQAATLDPKNLEPHLSLGMLLETRDPMAAEAEYKRALELDPKSSDAMAGLINMFTAGKRTQDAMTFLREFLKLQPENAVAHLQLGRLLSRSGDTTEAVEHYQAGLKSNPNDPDLLREMAVMYVTNKQYAEAETQYRALLSVLPGDATLHRDLGQVLMRLRKFPDAEAEFFESVKLDPKSPDTFGQLAIAAAQNKKFPLAIRALDERAKFAPETPATYFLRATSYDNLRALKDAAVNYHKFLEVAGGKFPDQEWQARHRLIAIEPEKK